jgi:hypothetical protein
MSGDAWLSFAYLYGVGGILFSLPIIAGLRFKVIDLRRAVDRRLLVSIIGTYFFYFAMQGLWTLYALS